MGFWWNTDLAIVHDGKIHIQTKYFENGYKSGKNGWYSCGLCTDGLFDQTYSYFEIRCILPKGTGIWPSLWMMPHQMNDTIGNGGIDGAEIDVFEAANYQYRLSNNVNVVSSAIHYDACGSDQQKQTVCTPFLTDNDPYEEYNTYGVEWNEKEYIFYHRSRKNAPTSSSGEMNSGEGTIVDYNHHYIKTFP
ncbi:MAG: glycoside hydrolase family 16 protein [Clostridia bacterium]|nr:glycoside hydrolase family 16 protein [Clostridia bacterium]